MTPLAHKLTRQLLEGLARGLLETEDGAAVREAVNGARFFDLTNALPAVNEVASALRKTVQDGEVVIPCTFLPAPKTWIEWLTANGTRSAAIIRDNGDEPASVEVLRSYSDRPMTWHRLGGVDLKTGMPLLDTRWVRAQKPGGEAWGHKIINLVTIFLAMINSPRIVRRRVHAPHKGLARELARTPGAGIGPLQDWHEIKLEIAKPRDVDDGEPHEDIIRGRRALHFCRKHIRVRLGRLEYVREHWRGDPAIGISRATYRVTA
jgi:hypothetical protein